MTKTLIGISITLAAGLLAAGAWFTHAPDGEVAAARGRQMKNISSSKHVLII